MNREDILHRASLFQRVAAADHIRSVRAMAWALQHKGRRRKDLMGDAAAYQLLAADNHKHAAALIALASDE